MIYLDNAATSLKKPQAVIDAVVDALNHAGNAGRGSSESALAATRTIFQTRLQLSQLINNPDPHGISFTHNATDSLNTVIRGLFQAGDHVITTVMEHNSVLRPLYDLMDQGLEVTFLDRGPQGHIEASAVQAAIRPNTKAMVLTHASNVTGDINPIKSIAQVLHQAGCLCIVDASQTMGAIPIDVQDLGIDVLCFTGHKSLLGPQGTGGIYRQSQVAIRPLKSGGTGVDTFNHHQPDEYPTHLESGTLNSHGLAGLKAGVDYLLNYGVDRIQKEERALLDYFHQAVQTIPGIRIYGHFDPQIARCPILSLNIADLDSAFVSEELIDRAEIMTRAGGHCAPLMHQALKTKEQGVVRFSLSHYTSQEELDQTVQCLKAIQAEFC